MMWWGTNTVVLTEIAHSLVAYDSACMLLKNPVTTPLLILSHET